MSRLASPLLALLLAAAPAFAQKQPPGPRWESGLNQGIIEASIEARDGSRLSFTCSAGQENPVAAVAIEIRGTPLRGIAVLRLTLDGRSFPLMLENGTGRAVGPMRQAVAAAAGALVTTRAAAVTAEIPEIGWRQAFSLANVRDALGDRPGPTIVHGCGG